MWIEIVRRDEGSYLQWGSSSRLFHRLCEPSNLGLLGSQIEGHDEIQHTWLIKRPLR